MSTARRWIVRLLARLRWGRVYGCAPPMPLLLRGMQEGWVENIRGVYYVKPYHDERLT